MAQINDFEFLKAQYEKVVKDFEEYKEKVKITMAENVKVKDEKSKLQEQFDITSSKLDLYEQMLLTQSTTAKPLTPGEDENTDSGEDVLTDFLLNKEVEGE